MRKVIKIDQQGLFLEDVILNDNEVTPIDCVEIECPGGFYLPQWTDSEWTEGGIIPQVDLDAIKKELIAKSKAELDVYLAANPLLFTDGKYYSVTKDKQNLLNNAISVYQMKVGAGNTSAIIKWNATGEECVEWTFENIIQLALSIANYVEPFIAQQQALEIQISNCVTKEELDNIIIGY